MSYRSHALRIVCAAASLLLGATALPADDAANSASQPLSLVVMDPLAAPLSCPCVEGYAQRKYEVLAKHLEAQLGREVQLSFAEALEKALKGDAAGRADVIIGKDSVVRADARKARLTLTAIGRLTDKLGATTQQGLFVVYKDSEAKTAADLTGYRILFGPAECEEKHQAAMAVLKQEGVDVPKKLEINQACSDGAAKVVDLGADGRAAAVISSYAAPLLEGCGTIKKGDLRVVGKTKPVPFITAFTTNTVEEAERLEIERVIASAGTDPKLCEALESLIGFVPVAGDEEASAKKKLTSTNR